MILTMSIPKLVFWCCAGLAFYAYIGYPCVLFISYVAAQVRSDLRYLRSRTERRVRNLAPASCFPVSIIIPAYNEQEHLPKKLRNLEQLSYDPALLEVIFVSDGSTDATNELITNANNPSIRLLILNDRKGKPNALNQAMKVARNEIIVLSDAATLFETDAIQKLVRHFSDPTVGAVCGALRFDAGLESQQTEGVYWRYESAIRLMESRLGATLTASGALYALRKSCYRELAINTMIEDFVIPMEVRRQGLRVLYDPEVKGTDFPASSVSGEFTRRVRLAIGSFRALASLAQVPLTPFACLGFLSHKVLRWLVPFLFVGTLVANLFLISQNLYQLTLLLQLGFLLWALIGFAFLKPLKKVRFALLGYFLFSMNLAFLVGFFRFLVTREEATWQRVN